MPDREKVFDAIRNCITEPKCRDCPWDECEKFDCKKVSVPVSLMLDALKLLKEQEENIQALRETVRNLVLQIQDIAKHKDAKIESLERTIEDICCGGG